MLWCWRKNGHVTDFVFPVEQMKKKCLAMIQEAITQMNNRVPPNLEMFEGLSGLSLGCVLSHFHQLPFNNLPQQHLQGGKNDKI